MPATVPPAADDELRPSAEKYADSDQDAEGEETDLYQMDQQLQDAVHRAYSGEVAAETRAAEIDEDLDAEGDVDEEHIPNGEVDEETEPVGAVKIPEGAPSLNNDDDPDADADEDPEFHEQSDSEREASPGSSVSDEGWEAESNGRAEIEADNNTVRGNCM